jgi:hypothetical protein
MRKHACERICDLLPRGIGKDARPRMFGPGLGARHRQRVLGREMMEERTFGHACCAAQIVYRRRRIALPPHHAMRSINQSRSRAGRFGKNWTTRHSMSIPTGWYVSRRR